MRVGAYSSAKAAQTRMSEVLRMELEPLGVRVVTAIVGSADTPMFTRPGGRMKLPETSYYSGIEEQAYKQRISHQHEVMKPERLAKELVDDVLRGKEGLVWRGSLAGTVRFITWALPQWYTDRACNKERGVELLKRR